MVLRAVHIEEGIFHDLLHQGDGVPGGAFPAGLPDDLQPPAGVALVTDEVARLTGGIGGELPVAQGTLQLPLLLEIVQRRAADETAGAAGHDDQLLCRAEFVLSIPETGGKVNGKAENPLLVAPFQGEKIMVCW